MALLSCPECGELVSSRAACCVHCGCPLTPAAEPGTLDGQLCALVLVGADFNDLHLLGQMQELLGCGETEAQRLRTELPLVLKRGVPYQECRALCAQFGKGNTLYIYRDEDAGDPQRLADAAPLDIPVSPARPKIPRPLSFWQLVGAILTSLALWMVISWIITWLLSRALY